MSQKGLKKGKQHSKKENVTQNNAKKKSLLKKGILLTKKGSEKWFYSKKGFKKKITEKSYSKKQLKKVNSFKKLLGKKLKKGYIFFLTRSNIYYTRTLADEALNYPNIYPNSRDLGTKE